MLFWHTHTYIYISIYVRIYIYITHIPTPKRVRVCVRCVYENNFLEILSQLHLHILNRFHCTNKWMGHRSKLPYVESTIAFRIIRKITICSVLCFSIVWVTFRNQNHFSNCSTCLSYIMILHRRWLNYFQKLEAKPLTRL